MREQDSIEFFFDASPRILPENHAEAYQPTTFRLFVMPRLAGGKSAWK